MYTLREAAGGGTDVQFELVFLQLPVAERLTALLARAWLQRANAEAMWRLGALLA